MDILNETATLKTQCQLAKGYYFLYSVRLKEIA